MECEVCGRSIYGRARKVIIDGAKLFVCPACSQFTPSQWKYEPEKPKISMRQSSKPKRVRRLPRRELMSNDLVIAESYGKKIRQAREKLGLTHEELSRKIGEKISLLRLLETEKMVPDITLVKKLENMFRIKLLEASTKIQDESEISSKKPTSLTLGDVVVLQKRKRDVT